MACTTYTAATTTAVFNQPIKYRRKTHQILCKSVLLNQNSQYWNQFSNDIYTLQTTTFKLIFDCLFEAVILQIACWTNNGNHKVIRTPQVRLLRMRWNFWNSKWLDNSFIEANFMIFSFEFVNLSKLSNIKLFKLSKSQRQILIITSKKHFIKKTKAVLWKQLSKVLKLEQILFIFVHNEPKW